MGRYSGIKMTKLTHYIIKNFNPNVKMSKTLSYLISRVPDHVYISSIEPEEYYALAKRLGMDGTVFTTILKENYDRLVQIRDKHGLRSIQLTLDLLMAHIVKECRASESSDCERIRKLVGVKKGWL